MATDIKIDTSQPTAFVPYTNSVIIPHAQIITSPTTPVELMPAPGAGKWIVPLTFLFITNTAAGEYTNTDDHAFQISYETGDPISNMIDASFLSSAGIKTNRLNVNELILGVAAFDGKILVKGTNNNYANAGIVLSEVWAFTDFTGGNAANTMKVTVYYAIIDV